MVCNYIIIIYKYADQFWLTVYFIQRYVYDIERCRKLISRNGTPFLVDRYKILTLYLYFVHICFFNNPILEQSTIQGDLEIKFQQQVLLDSISLCLHSLWHLSPMPNGLFLSEFCITNKQFPEKCMYLTYI